MLDLTDNERMTNAIKARLLKKEKGSLSGEFERLQCIYFLVFKNTELVIEA